MQRTIAKQTRPRQHLVLQCIACKLHSRDGQRCQQAPRHPYVCVTVFSPCRVMPVCVFLILCARNLCFSSVQFFFSRPRPILVVSARQCVTSTGTLKAARQYYQPARWPTRWGRVSGYFRRKTPTCETTAASEHVSDL